MKPDASSPSPASQPTDLLSLLRSLSLQTDLELTGRLQDPLINRLKKHLSEDEIWELLFEAVREANLEQGWKR